MNKRTASQNTTLQTLVRTGYPKYSDRQKETMARSSIRAYLHADYLPGERLLVQKIDFFILTFCCISYFMNYVRNAPHFPSRAANACDQDELLIISR